MDQAADTAEANITGGFDFQDDGPQLDIAVDGSATFSVTMDESIVNPTTVLPDANAGDDDTALTAVNGTDPIGSTTTQTGDLSGLFIDVLADAGTDGEKDRTDSYKLVLRDAAGALVAQASSFTAAEGVATTLLVTDFATGGNPDLNGGNPYDSQTVYLFLVSDTVIEGRVDADGNGTFDSDEVALRWTLDLTNPDDPLLTTEQIFALEQPDNPNNYDEAVTLAIAGNEVNSTAGINVAKDSVLTDGDMDQAADTAEANITGGFDFQDDGPQLDIAVDGSATFSVTMDESIVSPTTVLPDANAGDDDTALTAVNGTDPIGSTTTQTGDLSGLFIDVLADAGTDGEKDRTDSYKLVLRDAAGALVAQASSFTAAEGVATTLLVTDFATGGNPDLNGGAPYDSQTVYLFLVSDTVIEGRVDADGNGTFDSDEVALRWTLDLTNPDDPLLTTEQIFALEQPDNPDNYDEAVTLAIAGNEVEFDRRHQRRQGFGADRRRHGPGGRHGGNQHHRRL